MSTKKSVTAALMSSVLAISDFRTKRYSFVGPSEADQFTIPPGLSRISCSDFIGIAFVDPVERNILKMFSLEPGKIHPVLCPDNVLVIVECGPEVKWFVSYSQRFNQSDPTRVEAALLRPRTDKEEMQDYLNEVAARALGMEQAQKLRTGAAEIDLENDDYEEYYEDDEHAPLTVYQMKGIIDIMQQDLKREIELAKKDENQLDIEGEAKPIPLKTPQKEAGPKGDASGSAKTGEVEQE